MVTFIKANPNLFSFLLFDETMEDHCKQMRFLGTWRTQVELQALSCLLHAQVYVLCERSRKSTASTFEWRVYKDLTIIPYPNIKFPDYYIGTKSLPSTYRVELFHTQGNYFDRVVPRDPTLCSLYFPPVLPRTDASVSTISTVAESEWHSILSAISFYIAIIYK